MTRSWLLETILRDVGRDNARAFREKSPDSGFADAVGAAGDNNDFALVSGGVHVISSFLVVCLQNR